MEFGDLKKWHFGILLPLFSGLLVMAYLMMEPPDEGRRMAIQQFENEVLWRPVGKTNPQPRIQDIRVYPPVNGLYVVNFKRLVEDYQKDSWKLQNWSFIAGKAPGNTQTVPEWLASLKQLNPERVNYTYEWWREPKRLWTVWGIFAGLLFLWGVGIPTVMFFARGGAKELTGSDVPEPATAAARSGPTSADHDRLDNMLDRLEETTAAGAGPRVPGQGVAVGSATGTTPIALDGKPLEAIAVAASDEKPKDFKGEFYPVARKK